MFLNYNISIYLFLGKIILMFFYMCIIIGVKWVGFLNSGIFLNFSNYF